MKALIAAVLVACSLFVTALMCDTPHEAYAQVSRPNPSATAQADPMLASKRGLPQPSARPSCAAGEAYDVADPNGCIYDCSGGRFARRAAALGASCVFPTTGATATASPTPTGSPSPTATATA